MATRKLRVLDINLEQALADYKIAFISREASLMGRKEVLSGKAKFGIFGDGKEVAQVALARHFQRGDWRSGYYRDQTLMFALGAATVRQFFAQLYADTQLENDPHSGGRQMNSHFASRSLDENGEWVDQLSQFNTSADASPTASQMARLLGLAYASKLYRQNSHIKSDKFSSKGQEIAFGTIGNASTSEGIFWETLNAAGVLQVPMVMSVWDDEYGISVPAKYQTTKESISEICSGFHPSKGELGIKIHVVKGWDYPALLQTYEKACKDAREKHIPSLVHVIEMTQPQGHSTSGSHERYKSQERLEYEASLDCLDKMKSWLINDCNVSLKEIKNLEEESLAYVKDERAAAWEAYISPIKSEKQECLSILAELSTHVKNEKIDRMIHEFANNPIVNRKSILSTARKIALKCTGMDNHALSQLHNFIQKQQREGAHRYNSHLLLDNRYSALQELGNQAQYSSTSKKVDGRQVIQRVFELQLEKRPELFIIGEDVGKLGGVNLEFDGLSDQFGEMRVTDTGIREASILGQGIGSALRGLRPIVDIQYLDYLLYALQVASDDLACLLYRTAGGQSAPVIIRTKGHRLEGVWHTGSPIGMILHSLRGLHVCVPRNMVQAAGIYNTLLDYQDPALVIEVLNGYRLKEVIPDNLSDFKVPLGQVDLLREGSDITLVTYGACVQLALEAGQFLADLNIELEIIDVQTLLPFDRDHRITQSIKKTNAVLFVDEDVPGGASSHMLREVIEVQGSYDYLDAPPKTLTAKEHRSPYGTDGDYFSKPSVEDIIEAAYSMMHEQDPNSFPHLPSIKC